MTSASSLLGVIGGMGPLAGADFFTKLIKCTPAVKDEGHIPVLLMSDPTVPSRPKALLEGGPSPVPRLIEILQSLEKAGVKAIAIPCITAHYWFAQLQAATKVPIISIVDATIREIRRRANGEQGLCKVGLLGTQGTISTGFLRKRLEDSGCCRCIMLDDLCMSSWVYPAITGVKVGGPLDGPAKLLSQAVSALRSQGADWVVLACTELPLLVEYFEDGSLAEVCIDPSLALAQDCVQWWQDAQQPDIVSNTEQPEQA